MNHLKSHLSNVATRIVALKKRRKTEPNGYVPGLQDARYNYRVNHIVYCLLRGRSLEQIERYPIDPKSYLMQEIERLIAEYREEEVANVG